MAVQNPDRSWAVIVMNNLNSDQEVVLSFSAERGQFWEGIVPKMTVTTWLIPSQQILSQTNGTQAASMAPPYPFGNGSLVHPTGSGMVTGTGFSACSITSTSTSTTSGSSSATVLPVPNTTHTIATSDGA
ncbi:hypothetical protein LTS10_004357 [Elasticomyces elasticus]|nr:hypothetical protein LTS10_004357 [Elasticomyces elasticus]